MGYLPCTYLHFPLLDAGGSPEHLWHWCVSVLKPPLMSWRNQAAFTSPVPALGSAFRQLAPGGQGSCCQVLRALQPPCAETLGSCMSRDVGTVPALWDIADMAWPAEETPLGEDLPLASVNDRTRRSFLSLAGGWCDLQKEVAAFLRCCCHLFSFP